MLKIKHLAIFWTPYSVLFSGPHDGLDEPTGFQ